MYGFAKDNDFPFLKKLFKSLFCHQMRSTILFIIICVFSKESYQHKYTCTCKYFISISEVRTPLYNG